MENTEKSMISAFKMTVLLNTRSTAPVILTILNYNSSNALSASLVLVSMKVKPIASTTTSLVAKRAATSTTKSPHSMLQPSAVAIVTLPYLVYSQLSCSL